MKQKNQQIKQILVGGGLGFIGVHLTKLLLKKGYKVTVFDNLRAGKRENLPKGAKFIQGDIRYYNEVKQAMKGCQAVFHLAAIPRVLYSVNHPDETHDVNVNGTLNILHAANEMKVGKVIFASSSSVCGNTKNFPTKETEPYAPLCPYALQKATAEISMKMYAELYGIDMTVARFFNVYGSGADVTSEYSLVIGKFIDKLEEDKPIQIYGDGKQLRDFSHVSDVVDGCHKCLKLKGFNIINLGNGNPVSINQIVKILKKEFPKMKCSHVPAKPGEARKTHADNSKARKLLGWKPKVSIEKGIEKLILHKWWEA